MKIINIGVLSIVSVFLLKVFFSWFSSGEIIGGDWPYYYKEMISSITPFAPLWTSQDGGSNSNFPLFSYVYFTIGVFVNTMGISWDIVYKIFWFGLFIVLSIYSSDMFIKNFLKNSFYWQRVIGIMIFLTNTYILMVAGGGQIGIALSYALAPLIFVRGNLVLKNVMQKQINNLILLKLSLLFGLSIAFQAVFDIRIAYITDIVLFGYVVFFLIKNVLFRFTIKMPSIIKIGIFCGLIPFLCFIVLHVYWLFPFLFFHLWSVPAGITSVSGFSFFSFADFSHAFSFLHPNWPENIFGKMYFQNPEFIGIPMLAYGSLFFLHRTKISDKSNVIGESKTILFFIFLGIAGSFLAKGDNQPFGQVNMLIFKYIPGMNAFRDPTKFYLLIAMSYSLLIPFFLQNFMLWCKEVKRMKYIVIFKKFSSLIPFIFLTYWILLLYPALNGRLTGTFHSYAVPNEYIFLKDFIFSQPDFSRTLWVPSQSRFRAQSENHPLLEASDVLKTNNVVLIAKKLKDKKTQKLLNDYSIKYIIIPYDSTGEIFQDNRKYSDKKRKYTEKIMDSVDWLKKIQNGKITIYLNTNYRKHLFSSNNRSIAFWNKFNTEYFVTTSSSSPFVLTLSENYSFGWKASINNSVIFSDKTWDGLNSFKIPSGHLKILVYFEPQRYVVVGYAVSFFCLLFISAFLFCVKIRR